MNFKNLPEVRSLLKPTVILIRHGETDYNDPQTHGGVQVRGWADIPLTDKGRKEGRKIADTVADFPVQRLYTSDLKRATETAKLVGDRVDEKPIRLHMLRPWNVGKYSGRLWTEVKKEMERLETVDPDQTPPGGESFRSFKHRWLTALKAILSESALEPSNGFILCVTHTRNLRVALAWLEAGADREEVDNEVLTSDTEIATGGGLVLIKKGERWTKRELKGKGAGHAGNAS